MQPINTSSETDYDEIDLRELIIGLWQGKWLILSVMLLFVSIVLGYLFFIPQTYQGTLPVKTIPAIDESAYHALSQLGIFTVDRDLLANTFLTELDNRQVLVKQMRAMGYVTQGAGETNDEFYLRSLRTANENFLFKPLENNPDGHSMEFLNIQIKTQQPALTLALVSNTIAEVTELVKTKLTADYSRRIATYKQTLNNRSQDLKTEESLWLSQLDEEFLARKKQLALNVTIARDLGLAQGLYVQLVQNKSDILNLQDITNSTPHYSQGYVALEKELELLHKGQYLPLKSTELKNIQAKINQLKNDHTVSRASQRFDNTPLAQGEFQAVRYNTGALDLTAKTSPILIILLSLMLGGVVGVVVLVLRNIIMGAKT